MPVQITEECWNCGKSYNPVEIDKCEKCGEYFEDEPLENEFDDPDFETN